MEEMHKLPLQLRRVPSKAGTHPFAWPLVLPCLRSYLPICSHPTKELLVLTSSGLLGGGCLPSQSPGAQTDHPKTGATFTVHPLEGERVLLVQAAHVSHFLTEVLERCRGIHAGDQDVPGTKRTGYLSPGSCLNPTKHCF